MGTHVVDSLMKASPFALVVHEGYFLDHAHIPDPLVHRY